MSATAAGAPGRRRFRCSPAARWLPRVLAGAVLAAAMIVAAAGGSATSRLVVLVGAVGAVWIVRQGSELRAEVEVAADAVVLDASGGKSTRLDFERIESIGFAPPFSSIARPFPAALLFDAFGTGFRVSALIEQGDRLVELLVERSGRDDLRAWVEARRVASSMRRATLWIAAGYSLAVAALLSAVLRYLH